MAIIEDPITNAKLTINPDGSASVNLPALATSAGFAKLLDFALFAYQVPAGYRSA